jgi:hypothetical protein
MSMETSLMALDGGDPSLPLLSSGPAMEEESDFSRLIAQSSTMDHFDTLSRFIPDELSRSLNF